MIKFLVRRQHSSVGYNVWTAFGLTKTKASPSIKINNKVYLNREIKIIILNLGMIYSKNTISALDTKT